MPTAVPDFGLADLDSLEIGGQINLLELVDGRALQQFKRRTVNNRSAQKPIITAWGITPIANVFPESITLTVVEEGIPHEKWNDVSPTLSGTDCVALDAHLIFRARCTLAISGKCKFDATVPPTGWTSAVGSATLATAIATAKATGTWIKQQDTRTKLRTDWHRFNLQWTQVVAGEADGSHIYSVSLIDAAAAGEYGAYTLTWGWSAEGFPTQSESFQQS